MRTLREMGITSVAVYSDADRTSLHVRMADEVERIGAAPAAESYLRIDRILDAARRHGAEGFEQVVAPMPGRVVRLLVEAGRAVSAGQGLLVIEAMKMQNELSAPKSGTVVSMAARQGATVAAGEVLAVIE